MTDQAIISREAARAAGLKRYFDGVPCKLGRTLRYGLRHPGWKAVPVSAHGRRPPRQFVLRDIKEAIGFNVARRVCDGSKSSKSRCAFWKARMHRRRIGY
jgi:hypothetical protein